MYQWLPPSPPPPLPLPHPPPSAEDSFLGGQGREELRKGVKTVDIDTDTGTDTNKDRHRTGTGTDTGTDRHRHRHKHRHWDISNELGLSKLFLNILEDFLTYCQHITKWTQTSESEYLNLFLHGSLRFANSNISWNFSNGSNKCSTKIAIYSSCLTENGQKEN